eukprot:15348802-Ditylum_brightwellii.AAC.1
MNSSIYHFQFQVFFHHPIIRHIIIMLFLMLGVIVYFAVVCSNHSSLAKLYIMHIVGVAVKKVIAFNIAVP